MAAFLKDLSRFYGEGGRNQAGQTLEEFLEAYDPRRYQTPSQTVDAVIFSCQGEKKETLSDFQVLLVKRSNHPSIGYWALPGGFVELREDLADAAKRELKEETGVVGVTLEQLATYGNYDRDPRTRVITTAYLAVVQREEVTVKAGDDAADAAWFHCSLESTEKNVYALQLESTEKGASLEAKVRVTQTEGLVQAETYEVLDGGKIAVDHAAILTQAALLLKSRLKREKNA